MTSYQRLKKKNEELQSRCNSYLHRIMILIEKPLSEEASVIKACYHLNSRIEKQIMAGKVIIENYERKESKKVKGYCRYITSKRGSANN